MNRLDAFFATGRQAFVPYVTAGYPSVRDTVDILRLLVASGADVIELGFPFSDPIADGPVIQAASQQALAAGFRRDDYFAIVSEFRRHDPATPLVAFTYYNPVFSLGVDRFAKKLAAAGGDALLIVDLPFEEQAEVRPALARHGLHLISLLAPTTSPARAKRILAAASGFVYQIAVKGVTGVRTALAASALRAVRRTRALTTVPVCLGFGVSTGRQARAVAQAADGVVVGSALVKAARDGGLVPLVRELRRALG